MSDIQTILERAGMDPKSSEIYLILVQNGESTVPDILQHTELSRATVYDMLSYLIAEDFVTYRKEGRVAYYAPVHPNRLFALFEQKKQDLALLEQDMKVAVQSLSGSYSLGQHRPGVRYFEGVEGIKEILEDSLTSREEIYTYADIEAIVTYIDDINTEYVEKRDALGIKKKAIIADTSFSREYLRTYHIETTDIRFLGAGTMPFHNVMQIYDDKISYITLTEHAIVGVIIQDAAIANMHKSLFLFSWQQLEVIADQSAVV